MSGLYDWDDVTGDVWVPWPELEPESAEMLEHLKQASKPDVDLSTEPKTTIHGDVKIRLNNRGRVHVMPRLVEAYVERAFGRGRK